MTCPAAGSLSATSKRRRKQKGPRPRTGPFLRFWCRRSDIRGRTTIELGVRTVVGVGKWERNFRAFCCAPMYAYAERRSAAGSLEIPLRPPPPSKCPVSQFDIRPTSDVRHATSDFRTRLTRRRSTSPTVSHPVARTESVHPSARPCRTTLVIG